MTLAHIAPPTAHEAVGGALTPWGFSTGVVVDATADEVRDRIGRDSAARAASTAQLLRAFSAGRAVQGEYAARTAPTYTLAITGGTVALCRQSPRFERDTAPALDWRALGQEEEHPRLWWDEQEGVDEQDRTPEKVVQPAHVIVEWSRKSRARMVRRLAEIDHDSWTAPGDFAMVTLTLPDGWLTVAPNGRAFKKMVDKLRKRWRRVWMPWQVAWKLEFQKRGAPHLHLLTKVPAQVNTLGYDVGLGYGEDKTFDDWLRKAWAEVVNSTGRDRQLHELQGVDINFGYRVTDPRRVAIYFFKHSAKTQDSKEYQHIVPKEWRAPGKGPGRFWGISGLKRTVATVELDAETFYSVRRVMRRLHRAQRARIAMNRRRVALDQMVGDRYRRRTLEDLSAFGLAKDRLLRSARGGGWILSEDGPAVAFAIATFVAARARVGISPKIGPP